MTANSVEHMETSKMNNKVQLLCLVLVRHVCSLA